jgi:hypothetical protein
MLCGTAEAVPYKYSRITTWVLRGVSCAIRRKLDFSSVIFGSWARSSGLAKC